MSCSQTFASKVLKLLLSKSVSFLTSREKIVNVSSYETLLEIRYFIFILKHKSCLFELFDVINLFMDTDERYSIQINNK